MIDTECKQDTAIGSKCKNYFSTASKAKYNVLIHLPMLQINNIYFQKLQMIFHLFLMLNINFQLKHKPNIYLPLKYMHNIHFELLYKNKIFIFNSYRYYILIFNPYRCCMSISNCCCFISIQISTIFFNTYCVLVEPLFFK